MKDWEPDRHRMWDGGRKREIIRERGIFSLIMTRYTRGGGLKMSPASHVDRNFTFISVTYENSCCLYKNILPEFPIIH